MNSLNSFIIVVEQIIILFFFISSLTEIYKEEKFNLHTKSLILLFSGLISFGVLLLKDDLSFIVNILAIIPLFILYRYVLKCSKGFSIISTILLLLAISLSEMFSFISIKVLLNIDNDLFYMNQDINLVFHILKFVFSSIIFAFSYNFLKNADKEQLKLIDLLSERELSFILLIVFTFILSNMFQFSIVDNEYNLYLLSFSVLQLTIIASIIYLSLKYMHSYLDVKCELKQEKLYNKALTETSDSLRLLKHDYNNILQAINGYIVTKQYDELELHIKKLTNDTKNLSKVEAINPNIINQPAIYGILGAKYFRAKKKNVEFNLSVNTNINEISFDFTELSKILGILLDNAIEASEKSLNRKVFINFSYNKAKQADIIEIKNTINSNSGIDITKIFNKGVSSKKIKSGLGLWEVKKIISSKANSQIYANIDNNEFSQTIIVEKC